MPDKMRAAGHANPASATPLEGHCLMRTTPAARRQAVTEPAAPDPDDWSIEAITARADALPNGTIGQLSGLFHSARLTGNVVNQRALDAEHEARGLYPEPPPEIRPADYDANLSAVYPSDAWPPLKLAIWTRWERQCRLIDAGLELEAVQLAADNADRLKAHLGARVIALPVKTLVDAAEKLAVILDLYTDGRTVDAAPVTDLRNELSELATPRTAT